MKLTKYKVGLTLTVLLTVLLVATVSGIAVTEDGDTWIIENQSDFNHLVGNDLSGVDFDGDSIPDVKSGDTIALDVANLTQTASITIDLQNVTVEPTEDIVESDNVVTFQQISGFNPYDSGNEHEIDIGPSSTTTVSNSIVITKEGAHIKSINFEPESGLNIDNAILVDVEDPCACQTRDMLFENLQIPTCGANGFFGYGIRFTGSITDYGARNTNYSNVDFHDVRIDGVEDDGVNFADSVGGVSDLHFNKLYVGNCGIGPTGGHGIFFNNNGKVENVRLENSTGLGKEQALKYGIEKNQDGIRVNGDNVTKLAGFRIEDFEIKNNYDNGIYILGNWNVPSEISSIDMTVKDTEISENGDVLGQQESGGAFDGGFGIIVGELDYEGVEPPEVSEIYYSPAKLDKVTLDNVNVFNNKSGGAGFFVSTVISSSPGFEVSDSYFNKEQTEDNDQQAFGLTVASYEGIKELDIDNSTFHDHDGGLSDVTLSGLPDQNLSDGIALLAAYQDGAHDDVENVTIQNTSANDNLGNGLKVAGKNVDNLNIKKVGKFNENGKNGIHVYGDEGVRNVTIEDTDNDGEKEITANGNEVNGLLVESNAGDMKGIELTNARFGKEGSVNGDSGVKLVTHGPDSSIGSSNTSGALKIKDVVASYNLGHGLEIDSAEDFLNPSSNTVVQNSEFNHNQEDGLHLEAEGDVMNPQVKNSSFVGNDVGTYGMYLEFGKDLLGTGGAVEIEGNVFAGNTEGLVITSPDPSNPDGSVNNLAIKDNTTFYAGNEEEYNGNKVSNIALIAGQLNSIDVTKNILVGEKTEVGLFLQAADSSSAITVNKNIFRTGAEGACIGLGTAVVLDAWNADINHNEFNGFSTAVEVLQEKAISASDSADDTSNHINNNNIVGCCTTINAEALKVKSDDTGNLYMVDATSNYWGPDATEQNVGVNIVAPEHVFFGDILADKVEVINMLDISTFKTTTSEPQVGKTVDLEYTLKNVSDSKISGQSVRLIVKDPGDNIILDTPKENVPELNSGGTYTNTHSFLPTEKGEYSATLEVDEGAEVKTISITVEEEPGPGPGPTDNYTPDWAKTGIMPAPVDGSSTPKLEITNEEGNSIKDADVSEVTINVFDLSGKKLLTFEGSITGLSAINDLENGLYLYSAQLTTDDGDFQSPVKKFVVKK